VLYCISFIFLCEALGRILVLQEEIKDIDKSLDEMGEKDKKAYYLKKRVEGKTHNHALRCLARQLIKVIHRMLIEERDYIVRKELKKAA